MRKKRVLDFNCVEEGESWRRWEVRDKGNKEGVNIYREKKVEKKI